MSPLYKKALTGTHRREVREVLSLLLYAVIIN